MRRSRLDEAEQAFLQAAGRLEDAVEAGDGALVAELAVAQEALFDELKAGGIASPPAEELERLRDLVDRGVRLLAEAARDTAAELEAVRAWRRCLQRYRPQVPAEARFLDRKG